MSKTQKKTPKQEENDINKKRKLPDQNYLDYPRKMRLQMSDKNMIHEDGSICHEYFNVKKGQFWSSENQQLLQKGIGKYGVGDWKQIRSVEFNKSVVIQQKQYKKSESVIELRTCLLLGISNISQYEGKKLTVDQIDQEKQKNLKIAKEKNKLQSNMYMND